MPDFAYADCDQHVPARAVLEIERGPFRQKIHWGQRLEVDQNSILLQDFFMFAAVEYSARGNGSQRV
jgi:hypothetical protein